MLNLPKLIVVLGPTASGKTELVIKLAKRFNGEIVAADSRTVYCGMDIGTAKPAKDKGRREYYSRGVRHFLIDVVEADADFTLANYKKLAVNAIRNILHRAKVPFLVGGTGLYIQAVVDNLQIPKVPPNWKLRKKIEKEIQEKGLKKVYQKLLKLDPGAKNVVQAENSRRVIRALEVCLETGKPFTKLQKKGKPLFDVLQIGLLLPREELYKRINERVEEQVKEGLVKETKKLAKKYNWSLPSMSGLGYKQIGMYLRGEVDLPLSVRVLERDTRHYARRQMTWFSRDKKIRWICPPNLTLKAVKLIKQYLRSQTHPDVTSEQAHAEKFLRKSA